jgi:hypothetical protein
VVADLHHFEYHVDVGPDPALYFIARSGPAFHFTAVSDPDPASFQNDDICDHWSIDPQGQGIHYEPPGLHCERPRLFF